MLQSTLRAALEELFWNEDKEADELEAEFMMVWRFAGLVFMKLSMLRPRWWVRKFLPYWQSLTAEELARWYVGEDTYAVYTLVSPWTSLSYVGKAWSGIYTRVTSADYCGSDMRVWLEKAAAGDVLDNDVTIMPGVGDSTSWKMVTLMFGHNEVETTMVVKGKRARCIQTLAECVQLVRRRAVRLCFEKGVTQVHDRWARKTVTHLLRHPETRRYLYNCTLAQLVRLFEVVRAEVPWEKRAKLRGHISLAAKVVYGFVMKGVYPLKLPPSDKWGKLQVRKVVDRLVADLGIPRRARVFVRKRTMPVLTSSMKLRDLFCNFRERTLLKDPPPCLCHLASNELPRVDGHVCVRTTDLHTGPLAILNRNLKDTPVVKVNFVKDMERACTEFAVQFSGVAKTVGDQALLRMLPVTLVPDEGEEQVTLSHAVQRVGGKLLRWVELRNSEGSMVQRTLYERFEVLLRRLAVWKGLGVHVDFLELLRYVAKRMLFWNQRVTRDYWITDYQDQNVLRRVLHLLVECFGSPFDFNLDATFFFTPYKEDEMFGAGVDAYSFLWHFCSLANPIYTVERIWQTVQHAVRSARTAKTTSRTVIIAPSWKDWTEETGVYRLMQLAKHKFKFVAPQAALGYVDKSTGARFNVDVLIVQNTKAARKYPITVAHLAVLRKHFAGRMSMEPRYEESWHVPLCPELIVLADADWEVGPVPRKLLDLEHSLKSEATLKWQQNLRLQQWMADFSLRDEAVDAGDNSEAVSANEYCRVLERLCAGTARVYLDRNAGVGALVCQRRYYDILVHERETSTALFEPAGRTEAEVVAGMLTDFNRFMLGNVCKFRRTGTFGATYALLKDKCVEIKKYRPVQPNSGGPIAPLQNLSGRAIEFMVEQAGGSLTLGGTHRLMQAVKRFNEKAQGARGIYLFGFDVKDQFSTLEHRGCERAVISIVEAACAKSGKNSVLVNVRGSRGVQCWFVRHEALEWAVVTVRAKHFVCVLTVNGNLHRVFVRIAGICQQ
ncbi:hypothetical protein CYMTET_55336 [Cymbomonas tetramitiformis]|uniref:Uncharacterized protein n=1 Tax=Cymbomonas tetramitiformis TaxID=36881 RepID=A0AAE0BEW4_9CHLO|nr:hypothetical protein CYMTET_55336 [Cymbomonas tetramitiformis]